MDTYSEKYIALVVDDDAMNRAIVIDMLDDEFECISAADGEEAIEMIDAHFDQLSVILLDLLMPKKTGIEVLEYLNSTRPLSHMPVLIVTEERSIQVEQQCLSLGAVDFVRKPFNAALVRKVTENAAQLYHYQQGLEHTIAQQTAVLRQQAAELIVKNERLQRMNTNIIDFVSDIVEARNLESGQHVKRVKGFTRILAEQLLADDPECGLTPALIDLIVSASALHDVGKIMVPDGILLKPGKLTNEEFAEIKKHAIYGCQIVEKMADWSDADDLSVYYSICRYHHEKYDGRGYPDGLVGEDIPLAAQLVSVADCYDALTTERVYKPAYSPEEAFRMIYSGECGCFSERLMRSFAGCRDKMKELVV